MASDNGGVFFAYPENPELRAEGMRESAKGIRRAGVEAVIWQELANDGHIIIDDVCNAIDQSTFLFAEVSAMNSNVLFEAGFALGRNKPFWLLFDETDRDAAELWKAVSMFSTIGRTDYTNSMTVVNKFLEQRPEQEAPVLLGTYLAGAVPRQENAVFAPSLPSRSNAAEALDKMLARESHLQILGGGDELGLAPLQFWVQLIYRSSAAVIHLLGPQRVRATEHNARASFLAGVAHGLELPFLMVVEDGSPFPMDYRDKMFQYRNTVGLTTKVAEWLRTLPTPRGARKRLGRLALDVELPISSFGQYVAEYEVEELNSYFIPTSEFTSILQGQAKVFVGRKGTGKTATMTQAVAELRKDRRNLVVPIKPSSYELSGLIELLEQIDSDSISEYLLVNLWSYLIYTEVAVRAVKHAQSKPAGIGDHTEMRRLEQELEALKIDMDGDLAARLEAAVDLLQVDRVPSEGDLKQFIADQLRVQRLNQLRLQIGRALQEFDRVAVLIDNLDKAWEVGANYRLMSKFILSLLTTSGRLERQLGRPGQGGSPINMTLSVFLRTDIFDVVTTYAREPDKIGELSVYWQDPELLVRVLEERYAAGEALSKEGRDRMWEELFAPEVRGLQTSAYLLWRTLPRPRDFIFLANAALTTAINRKHSRIEEADIVQAEGQYSKFAFDALVVESEAQGFDLERVLFEFVGLESTQTAETIASLLAGADDPIEMRSWLVRSSFLGVETSDGNFEYPEGEDAGRKKLRVAERLAQRLNRPLRFRVHPAFRSYLEIHDEDLHFAV